MTPASASERADGVAAAARGRIVVASRGDGATGGIRLLDRDGDGVLEQGAALHADLRGLGAHPRLPVLYGISGGPGPAGLAAWSCGPGGALVLISQRALHSDESEPCHIAVAPDGDCLVVALYETGSIELWHLEPDGALGERADRVVLTGSSVDPDRQTQAHPHQVLFPQAFGGRELVVADLGGDLIHRFEISRDEARLSEVATSAVPPGTGPRHMVELPDGRLAVSGELAATLLVGSVERSEWTSIPSTRRLGAARSRSERNYPGDIAISPAGDAVFVANRGHDTIAVFDVTGHEVSLIDEVSTAAWPQHLHVTQDSVLVACQDDSRLAKFRRVATGLDPDGTEMAVPAPVWISAITGS